MSLSGTRYPITKLKNDKIPSIFIRHSPFVIRHSYASPGLRRKGRLIGQELMTGY
jgi:hypothetical protein